MNKTHFFLLFLFAFLFCTTSVYACRCKEVSVEDGVKYSSIVFKGKVLSVGRTYDYKDVDLTLDTQYLDSLGKVPDFYVPLYYVTLEVEKVYKGAAVSDTVNVITAVAGATCGFRHFSEGKSFIVYAYKGFIFDKIFNQPLIHLKEHQYWTNHCTRTWHWSKDEEDEILEVIKVL